MTRENDSLNHYNISEETLAEIAYKSANFHKIPPIIGFLFADLNGNAMMTFEYDKNSKYGPIKSYLIDKEEIPLDLISMYFSSFSKFASSTNIKGLSHLEIHGSDIKIQLYFLDEMFQITVFLNSNTSLSLKTREQVLKYLNEIIKNYGDHLAAFNDEKSKEIIRKLRNKGKMWLIQLNNDHIHDFRKSYIQKHREIDDFIEKIEPIIREELNEYLQVPEDIMNDFLREVKHKIHDKIFDLVSELLKK